MAPSAIDRSGFGITRLGSTSSFSPSPWQEEQAPKGELKEKRRGSISGKLIPQTSHAKCSENTVSFPAFDPPSIPTITTPLPSFKAVSKESTSRVLSISSSITRRSTTTSMWCFFLRSSSFAIASSTRWITPSTRTRIKPARCTSSSVPLCSPFFALTTGPRMAISDPRGNFIMCDAIWLTLWRFTSFPHCGQWGMPILANSRRR